MILTPADALKLSLRLSFLAFEVQMALALRLAALAGAAGHPPKRKA